MARPDGDPLEYVPNPDDEREVPLDDEVELALPPHTLDHEERVEDPELDEGGFDDARPA